MAFFSLGLNRKFYLIVIRMILQIRGLGTYDSGLSPSLRRASDHHLWQLVERGWAAVICNHPWKALCMKHKLEENFVQILHGEYFYLFIFFLHTLKRTV